MTGNTVSYCHHICRVTSCRSVRSIFIKSCIILPLNFNITCLMGVKKLNAGRSGVFLTSTLFMIGGKIATSLLLCPVVHSATYVFYLLVALHRSCHLVRTVVTMIASNIQYPYSILVAFIIKSRSISICQTRSIRSSEKECKIFLVLVGMAILFSSVQSAADHTLLKVRKNCAGARQHRWAWLSQIFLRCAGADLDLIMNAECFARIDLD